MAERVSPIVVLCGVGHSGRSVDAAACGCGSPRPRGDAELDRQKCLPIIFARAALRGKVYSLTFRSTHSLYSIVADRDLWWSGPVSASRLIAGIVTSSVLRLDGAAKPSCRSCGFPAKMAVAKPGGSATGKTACSYGTPSQSMENLVVAGTGLETLKRSARPSGQYGVWRRDFSHMIDRSCAGSPSFHLADLTG